ncbi:MAG TPA: tetratricopeptide repeat protein [Pyrinomonadaceae bacterium]
MNKVLLVLLASALPAAAARAAVGRGTRAQAPQSRPASAERELTNKDVIFMLKAGLSPEIIIAKIRISTASFDTSASALRELKDAGADDSVIVAMIEATAPAAPAKPAAKAAASDDSPASRLATPPPPPPAAPALSGQALTEVERHYQQGLAQLNQGRWAEAESEFRAVRRLDPKDTMRYGPFRSTVSGPFGLALLRTGKLAEAEAELSLAVQYEPQNAEYRGKLGLLYARQSRWAEAEEQLRKAARFDPDNNEYQTNLKIVLAKQRK